MKKSIALSIVSLSLLTSGITISAPLTAKADGLKLPEEIGRVEGPRDMNICAVEPTVMDERHYTSGRAERHQKTSPTLPEGAPIPDRDPAPSEKIDEAVKQKIASLKNQDTVLKLKLEVESCSESFQNLLKQVKSIEIGKVDSEAKTILVKVKAEEVSLISQYTGVRKISLDTSS